MRYREPPAEPLDRVIDHPLEGALLGEEVGRARDHHDLVRRPDLAGSDLARVRAPTLLVVGGADHQVLELNRQAAARIVAPHEIVVIPGATHLFPEEGALEQVVDHAVRWLDRWLPAPRGSG